MEIKRRKVVILHLGSERVIEIDNGPFAMAANDDKYYEGWVMPQPLDPYGEPYHVIFSADKIIRETD